MNPLLILGAAAALAHGPAEEQPLGQCLGGYVFFDRGSAQLTAGARSLLDSILSYPVRPLALENDVRLIVYASTDQVGSDASNLSLSRRRGQAIRRYFVSRGMPRQRVVIFAEGERPRFPLATVDDVVQRRNALIMIDAPIPVWQREMPNVIC